MTYEPNDPWGTLNPLQYAQAVQRQATMMGPTTSGVAVGLNALGSYLAGRQEQALNQNGQGAQPQGGQIPASIMARVLQDGGPSSSQAPSGATDDTYLPFPSPSNPNGGWAAAGQGAAQALGTIGRKSDRRLKTDVSRIGTLPNGLAVYRYRLEGGPHEIGLMADEVMFVHPDAVWIDPEDGFARVNYELAVA